MFYLNRVCRVHQKHVITVLFCIDYNFIQHSEQQSRSSFKRITSIDSSHHLSIVIGEQFFLHVFFFFKSYLVQSFIIDVRQIVYLHI